MARCVDKDKLVIEYIHDVKVWQTMYFLKITLFHFFSQFVLSLFPECFTSELSANWQIDS